MFQPDYVSNASLSDRLRTGLGRRTIAVAATLLLEALLVLMIWSLGQSREQPQTVKELLATFDATPHQPEPKPSEKPQPSPQKPAAAVQAAEPQPNAPPIPVPTAPPLIQLSPKQMQQADISSLPKGPPPPPGLVYGPPNTGYPGDSKRVGTAPDGQPLYAAAWYRKPYPGELDGYLSTAEHPGWGMIACKTAPDYRVEDCVTVDEYPDHSNYARAVLAAAWQFKVRPPRIGGRAVIGAWVRIKIYDETNQSNAE